MEEGCLNVHTAGNLELVISPYKIKVNTNKDDGYNSKFCI